MSKNHSEKQTGFEINKHLIDLQPLLRGQLLKQATQCNGTEIQQNLMKHNPKRLMKDEELQHSRKSANFQQKKISTVKLVSGGHLPEGA